MKSATRAALIAGAAFSMIAGTAAYAQQPAPAAPAAQAQKHHGMKRQFDPAARAQRLRDALQLTQAQEPALQAFLGSMRRPEGAQARKAPRAPAQALTTPQRLDRQAARMAERQQRFAQRAEATKRFYAALTPAQQKAFDAMHQGKGAKRGAHRMMRHGGRG